MLVYDDIFRWEGFGGALRLGSGKCRLRIFNLAKGDARSLTYLKPIIIVVSDLAGSKMSVRSCAGHVATRVTENFAIDPQRMVFVEYYPSKTYGEQDQHLIPERFEAVEFTWHQGKALHPRWRLLKPPLLDVIQRLTGNFNLPPSADRTPPA